MNETAHPEQSAKLLLAYLSTHRSVIDTPTLRRELAAHGVALDHFTVGLRYAIEQGWIEVDPEGAFLILTPDGKHFIQAVIWTERELSDSARTAALVP